MMHASRRSQRSTVAGFRCMALAGLLFTAAALPAFAAEADLALMVTVEPAPNGSVSGDVRFLLDVVNRGPDSAEDVSVEIDLPAEVSLVAALAWTGGSCQPGPPLICQLGQVGADAINWGNRATVSVDAVIDVMAELSLTARVASPTPDPQPDNNSATARLDGVEWAQSADLRVDPQFLPPEVHAAAAETFRIEIANDGPARAESVDVRVEIPELAMASYLLVDSSQGVCSSALDTCAGPHCQEVLEQPLAVSCDLGAMAAENRAAVRLKAVIDLHMIERLTVSVEVEVRDTVDLFTANNWAAVQWEVLPPKDLLGGAGGPVGCFIQAALW